MKKVAIVTRKMIIGGIEKALVEMLKAMPEEEYEIDLYLLNRGGELEKKIPSNVKIIDVFSQKSILKTIVQSIMKLKLVNTFNAFYFSIYSIKFAKSFYEQEKYMLKSLPILEKKYDYAISYHGVLSNITEYVIKKIKSDCKILWIHSSITKKNDKFQIKKKINFYKKFDKIYCVSKDLKNIFDKDFSELKEKTEVFYNIINEKEIVKLSKEKIKEDKFKGIQILTVGRLSKEKGQLRIPKILKKLIEKGYNLKWYLVGEGNIRKELEEQIIKYNLENRLILLGLKENPYPYFERCDLYIQPSLHEGYCITLAEAKLFNKPIIVTEFAGSFEQIENYKTGIRVKNSSEDIYNAIIELLENEKLKNIFKQNLENEKLNKKEIEKIVF